MTQAAQVVAALRERLARASPSAALDAEVLVAHVLALTRAELAADPKRALAAEELFALESLARRRLAGEPVAYLTGRREFWSLALEVNPDVLVPRPETELLVERTLAAIAALRAPQVLELGTGSGAAAIAVALERPDARVTATDVSAPALAVAARNAARLGAGNLHLAAGAWYEPVEGVRFDVVLSNPPYVAASDPALAALAAEPRIALVAGDDGLEALAVLAAGAPGHLLPGGALLLEHGAGQGAAVRALMQSAGLGGIATWCDLAGHERVTEGRIGR